jgi:hypothetical protein
VVIVKGLPTLAAVENTLIVCVAPAVYELPPLATQVTVTELGLGARPVAVDTTLVVTVTATSFVPPALNWIAGVPALTTPTQPAANVTVNVTPAPLAAPFVEFRVADEGETVIPPLSAAKVTAIVVVPESAATGFTTIACGVVPVAVLHVMVGARGVAVRRFAAIKECEPAVSATVIANRVEPCRLNTDKSIVDHPFYRKCIDDRGRRAAVSLSLVSISAGGKNTLGRFVFWCGNQALIKSGDREPLRRRREPRQ